MKNISLFAMSAVIVLGYVASVAIKAQSPQSTDTQLVVAAATAFLDSLTPDQQAKVQFGFDPAAKATKVEFARTGGGGGGGGFVAEQFGKAVWSNYPVSDVPRPGIQFGELTVSQAAAADNLLRAVLSSKGYQKILEIMGSDQALSDGGTNFASGRAVYTIAILGTPSVSAPWMLEFGGHHLGLNIVIAGEHGVATPTLTGAQPAVYTVNGQTVRALAAENDKGFALLNALDDTQRKQAILTYNVNDLVLGPGHPGEMVQPEGLKVSGMNDAQRALLLDVISEWAGLVREGYATPRMAEIQAGLADTYFAWSGPTTHAVGRNGSAYYRIQGPKVFIEFSPQGVGGDPTMHVHTIYRDPTNDYGALYLRPAISSQGGIVDGAGFQATISPTGWVAIFGQSLATSSRVWTSQDFTGNNLPTSLDGVSVSVSGRPAYVYYISPNQINAIAPGGIGTGSAEVQVTNSLGQSTVVTANVQTFSPGLFMLNPQGTRYVAAVHADGTLVGPAGLLGSSVVTLPAKPGEIVALYGSGFGPTSSTAPEGQLLPLPIGLSSTVTATVGGVSAQVAYSAMVQTGLNQINVIVPDITNGDREVIVAVGGVKTQSGASLAIQR